MPVYALKWIACMALACAGCAKSPGVQMRDGLQSVQLARQPQRLLRAGEAYAMLGDATRAAQYFALAIDNGGDEDAIFPRMLEVCVRDKQYRAALYYGQNYLRKHPDDQKLRFVLANLHGAMGENDVAQRQLERVLSASPGDSDAHYSLAVLIRENEGDVSEADRHFRAYLQLEPRGPHAEEARASLLKSVP